MMTDAPLRTAIKAAGSQAALAEQIGVKQQTVSHWLKSGGAVPAEKVIGIENATGVSRHDLRPDIFGKHPEAAE